MSEKAKRWRRYSYLGRIRQAENTLLSLSKEDFVSSGLRNHIDLIALDLERLRRKVDLAIKESRP